MPIKPEDLIIPGAGLIGTGINAWAQSANNRKMRNWNWRMYQQQRKDALADYYMQNEYNSPKNQMGRFKEAGLNPNLIYGQMSEGATVRSSDTGSYRPEAPQVDLERIAGSSMAAYYDNRIKDAQTDNLKKALEATDQQIKLTQAQTAATLAGAASTEFGLKSQQFDLALKEALRPLTLEAKQLEVEGLKKQQEKIDADIQYTVDQNKRAGESQTYNIQKIIQETLAVKAQKAKTEQETRNVRDMQYLLQQDWFLKELEREAKEYENKLRKDNIQPSDNAVMREAQRIYNKMKQWIQKNAGKNWKAPW